ncbi:MAG: hypothetical protein R3336_08590, partial [Phycisphaeraceae bacterium]|nr:hypothetical protein [Phycisphaeraceae bacterium]
MKYLFAVIALLLVVASVIVAWSMPSAQTEIPVIYWVTDPNPARVEQAGGFDKWLIENGHVTEDGKPVVQLRIETGNRTNQKI